MPRQETFNGSNQSSSSCCIVIEHRLMGRRHIQNLSSQTRTAHLGQSIIISALPHTDPERRLLSTRVQTETMHEKDGNIQTHKEKDMWRVRQQKQARQGQPRPQTLKRRHRCCLWRCSGGQWEYRQRGLGCAQCGLVGAGGASGGRLAGRPPPQGGTRPLAPQPGSPGSPHAQISLAWQVVPRTPPCRLLSHCPSRWFHLDGRMQHIYKTLLKTQIT